MAAHQAFGAVHGDGAHDLLAQVLGHFQHQPLAVVLGLDGIEDRRQVAVELDVDDRPHHLGDSANEVFSHGSRSFVFLRPRRRGYIASLAEMISISSRVMAA